MKQCKKCCIAAGIPEEYAAGDVCPVLRWMWGAKVPKCRYLNERKEK